MVKICFRTKQCSLWLRRYLVLDLSEEWSFWISGYADMISFMPPFTSRISFQPRGYLDKWTKFWSCISLAHVTFGSGGKRRQYCIKDKRAFCWERDSPRSSRGSQDPCVPRCGLSPSNTPFLCSSFYVPHWFWHPQRHLPSNCIKTWKIFSKWTCFLRKHTSFTRIFLCCYFILSLCQKA